MKASFRDTTRTVAKLREAAMEKKQEVRKRISQSRERLGGIIPEFEMGMTKSKKKMVKSSSRDTSTTRRKGKKSANSQSTEQSNKSASTNFRKFLNAQQKLSSIDLNDFSEEDIQKMANEKVLQMLEDSLHQFQLYQNMKWTRDKVIIK